MSEPTHKAILDAISDLDKKIAPLVDITPELKSMAKLYNAGEVGGAAVKWLATLGAAIIAITVALKAFGHWIVAP